MADIIISIWFFVIFIPGIYIVYTCMQCFDYEKVLKKGKTREFKILFLIMSVIIAFLFAFAFTQVLREIYNIIRNIAN